MGAAQAEAYTWVITKKTASFLLFQSAFLQLCVDSNLNVFTLFINSEVPEFLELSHQSWFSNLARSAPLSGVQPQMSAQYVTQDHSFPGDIYTCNALFLH